MLLHFGFLVFLALGGFLAWRWPWLVVPHVAAVTWGVLSVAAGLLCPLTGWEDWARRRAGEQGLPRGFIDTYSPASSTPPSTSWRRRCSSARSSSDRGRVCSFGPGAADVQGLRCLVRAGPGCPRAARKPATAVTDPLRAAVAGVQGFVGGARPVHHRLRRLSHGAPGTSAACEQ